MNQDTLSRNAHNHLERVFDALCDLMAPPNPPRRPIGFVTPEDKSKKTSAAGGKS
jgi:hypothetical protein